MVNEITIEPPRALSEPCLLLDSLDSKRIGSKSAIRIILASSPANSLIFVLVLVVGLPHLRLGQIPITMRAPQHALVYLAEIAGRSDHDLIIMLLPVNSKFSSILIMEAIDDLDHSGISPAIRSAIVSVHKVL
jgi:hypothetical protein